MSFVRGREQPGRAQRDAGNEDDLSDQAVRPPRPWFQFVDQEPCARGIELQGLANGPVQDRMRNQASHLRDEHEQHGEHGDR